MNYIYDILLNFNEEIYDFYEWNTNDDITHIRKIPIIKTNSLHMKNIKINYIEFEEQFLSTIKNKTEIFSGRTIKNMEYSFLISDGIEVIGFNIKNNKIKYSKLLLNEESEVLEVVGRLKENELQYNVLSKKNTSEFKTRKEREMYKFVIKEIKKLKNEENIDKLKYISYECFSEKIENDIYENLINKIDENYIKLYKIFKLIQVSK